MRPPRRTTTPRVALAAVVVAASTLLAACGSSATRNAAADLAADSTPSTSATAAAPTPTTTPTPLPAVKPPRAQPTPTATSHAGTTHKASSTGSLAGEVIVIDPGHNGGNFSHPADMAKQIWNGRAMEDCDTTGTQTNAGYTEARFNFRVARFLREDLRRAGARVVMTRHTNTGVGPCVDQRSRILNHSHAQVSIDIHGDGGPPGGRGFAILLPVPDGPNNHVIGSSARFGRDLKRAFLAGTRMPVSNYDGVAGFQPRDDLAGLNLTTMPKVLIEVGNMRNATDAAMMTSPAFQRRAARAMTAAIITFLTAR